MNFSSISFLNDSCFFFLLFNLGKEPVFDHKNVGLIYDVFMNIFENLESQNDLFISRMLQNLIDYIKEFKTSPNYKGSDEESSIKYIYQLFKYIITTFLNVEPMKKSIQENMVSAFLTGLEKECNENQKNIIKKNYLFLIQRKKR